MQTAERQVELYDKLTIAGVVYYVRAIRYDGENATLDLICVTPHRGGRH